VVAWVVVVLAANPGGEGEGRPTGLRGEDHAARPIGWVVGRVEGRRGLAIARYLAVEVAPPIGWRQERPPSCSWSPGRRRAGAGGLGAALGCPIG
jgi:hypothetical protein